MSPARRAASIPSQDQDDPETPAADTVVEYKTYRSPTRKREKDEVPSLCSAGSEPRAEAKATPTGTISCSLSMEDQTSPLATTHTSPLAASRKVSADSKNKDDGNTRAYSPPLNGDHSISNKVGLLVRLLFSFALLVSYSESNRALCSIVWLEKGLAYSAS